MSLRWDWKCKVGEITPTYPFRNTDEHIYIYNGNALSIWLWEDHDQYQMYNFFVDLEHLKNCDKEFEWYRGVKSVRFWIWNKQNKQLADYLIKHGIEVIIDTSKPFKEGIEQ